MPTPDELTIVHAADLHLGGRRWLRRAPSERALAEQLRIADLRSLSSLVDLCLAERASLLLLAGDIFDGWCRDHRVGLVLAAELARLREVGALALLVLGNHDLRSPVTRPLLLPESAAVLGAEAPETRLLSALGVAVHGWSHPRVSPGEDVVARFPAPLPGWLNVGLLHTSAEGRAGHADYAPCSRRSLRAHGYDYWALGHVHQREVVSVDPHVVFPGNLQGRGSREPGPRGATVVRIRSGRVRAVEARAVDAVRFETVQVDVRSAGH
ncbi:MAG: DNA repair exonuclease, partial [Deltaproteobacteria bacterium]|nr:DNA repair exonuclease [Deltaproteobacteria bacterium]